MVIFLKIYLFPSWHIFSVCERKKEIWERKGEQNERKKKLGEEKIVRFFNIIFNIRGVNNIHQIRSPKFSATW
jgi:hypothetical protein